jgi:acetyl-CoA carboxylase biotin carboxylase subunit
VWAGTRDEAIARMLRALDEYYVSGIRTNVTLFQRILRDPEFRRGEIHTRWLDDWLPRHTPAARPPAAADGTAGADAALLAAALWHAQQGGATRPAAAAAAAGASRWQSEGRSAALDRAPRR